MHTTIKVKVRRKVYHTSLGECMAGAHLPLQDLEPVGGEPLMSDAWPVRRQTYG